MKATCLLFLTISWAASMPGAGYAVPSNPASQQISPASSANTASGHPRDAEHAASPRDGRHPTDGKASDEQQNHGRASGTNHPPRGAGLTKANRPKQLPSGRHRSIPGNALHQRGSDKSRGAAKGGFIQNPTIHNALPVRMSSVVRPIALSPNNVRHRSPNPAVVAGPVNSDRRNNGAINGTHMNRKR